MEISGMLLLVITLFLSYFSLNIHCLSTHNDQNQITTYIIHMSKSQTPASFSDDHITWFDYSLKSVSNSAEMLYTYTNAIHGFSTRLTAEEARELETRPGIVAVLPETKYELHTTRTPMFLGLDVNSGLFPDSNSVSEIIVGVLDTGVWPESKSFDDAGLGPIPSSWKGICESGTNFSSVNCNRKLIGARYFSKGYEASLGQPIDVTKESKSPRDDEGHGTHTATTAAGSPVSGASLFGYAPGTAKGMASQARVAVYKVCWLGGCFSSDIMAALDSAISDNVNIISMSLGGGDTDYYRDIVAIGAFSAMEKGILVSCSAGNGGPGPYSLTNVAPWITTVGAGTLDRDFPVYVVLGNGLNFSGVSLYPGDSRFGDKLYPLVYAGNVSNATNGNLCMIGSLIPEKVTGKIVFCDRGGNSRVQKGVVVKEAGGVGMILANSPANGEELLADAHLLPASAVGARFGEEIKKYLLSIPNPTATFLFQGTKVGIEPSPVVAAFSSRGPNPLDPQILKPDIIAPGVNILAGWSGAMGPSDLTTDTRRVPFNIISGTSMSCPHVSGLAALVKAAHPDWSPAAIRSALMTTAYTTYKNGQSLEDISTEKPSTPFDHGSGHVNPILSLDPGLVYDLDINDYLNFLCAINYTPTQILTLSGKIFICDMTKNYAISDLNYPSFALPLLSNNNSTLLVKKYPRTLTNVDSKASTYIVSAKVQSASVEVSVEPQSLSFSQLNEKKSFTVTITAKTSEPVNTFVFGQLEWSDGDHIVKSPIAVSWT
ncbi:subtilisin-like protease SBT1.7 [Impatiens glandulifera]|uniref:subtilisin-like protease SBT1.7 n=1 Tax=Impatiens glandulifera TaxID=253017 RepID=UPI001FB07BE1|nr:subtilisin-like protease SBT1.7 [Impatiens glandulifera]